MERRKQMGKKCKQEISRKQMGLQDQRHGVYRARLVAKGFSQIPGEDFTENFSPVINDMTFIII